MERRTLEFVVGLAVAGGVSGLLSLQVATPYALAAGIAASTPAFVRASSGLDRDRYETDRSSDEQVVDGALAAGAALVVALAGGYLAVSNGYTGAVGAAVPAALGVFAGQAVFYSRNADYLE
ncbi:MAG: hypothetical protein ABEJ88_10270 [Halobacterium sp.]